MKLLDVQSQKHVIIVDLKIIDTKDSSRLLVCTWNRKDGGSKEYSIAPAVYPLLSYSTASRELSLGEAMMLVIVFARRLEERTD